MPSTVRYHSLRTEEPGLNPGAAAVNQKSELERFTAGAASYTSFRTGVG